jgi:hypothetical protein
VPHATFGRGASKLTVHAPPCKQALKKQIISVFEPIYLDVLNDNMVGFTNISARDMLDRLFSTLATSLRLMLLMNFI